MPNAKQSAARDQAIDDRVLRISRRLKAPRALVFKAFTDPMHLARWFGPEGVTVSDCKVEPIVGGTFRVSMRSAEGNTHRVVGIFKEVSANERLVFTWAWLDDGDKPGHETIVAITFREIGNETEILLLHERFDSADTCSKHNQGWLGCLVCLERYLAEQKT